MPQVLLVLPGDGLGMQGVWRILPFDPAGIAQGMGLVSFGGFRPIVLVPAWFSQGVASGFLTGCMDVPVNLVRRPIRKSRR